MITLEEIESKMLKQGVFTDHGIIRMFNGAMYEFLVTGVNTFDAAWIKLIVCDSAYCGTPGQIAVIKAIIGYLQMPKNPYTPNWDSPSAEGMNFWAVDFSDARAWFFKTKPILDTKVGAWLQTSAYAFNDGEWCEELSLEDCSASLIERPVNKVSYQSLPWIEGEVWKYRAMDKTGSVYYFTHSPCMKLGYMWGCVTGKDSYYNGYSGNTEEMKLWETSLEERPSTLN